MNKPHQQLSSSLSYGAAGFGFDRVRCCTKITCVRWCNAERHRLPAECLIRQVYQISEKYPVQQQVHDVERKEEASETQRFPLLLLELMANRCDETRLFLCALDMTESSITDQYHAYFPAV